MTGSCRSQGISRTIWTLFGHQIFKRPEFDFPGPGENTIEDRANRLNDPESRNSKNMACGYFTPYQPANLDLHHGPLTWPPDYILQKEAQASPVANILCSGRRLGYECGCELVDFAEFRYSALANAPSRGYASWERLSDFPSMSAN